MSTKLSRNIALMLPIFLFGCLIGCNNVIKATSTSTPLAETKSRWHTDLVMVILLRGGESFYTYFSPPPDVIIYSDGRQIIWHEGYLYEKYLSIQDICKLFTEVEDSGFFDYTSEEYKQFYVSHQMKPGPEYFSMKVDAWKNNSLQLNSFPFLFSQYKDKVEWPAALRIPYEQLTTFDSTLMHVYVPERIAVHIEKDLGLGTDLGIMEWKSTGISLSELINRYNETATPVSESSEGEIILAGEESKDILEQFDNNPLGGPAIFTVNGERYLVAIRALLPYEQGGGVTQPLIPDPNIKYSPVSMSCLSK